MNQYDIDALFRERSMLSIAIDLQEQLVKKTYDDGGWGNLYEEEAKELRILEEQYDRVQKQIDGIKGMQKRL